MSSSNRGRLVQGGARKRGREDEEMRSSSALPPSSPPASSPPMMPQDDLEEDDELDPENMIQDIDDAEEMLEDDAGIDLFGDNFERDYLSLIHI